LASCVEGRGLREDHAIGSHVDLLVRQKRRRVWVSEAVGVDADGDDEVGAVRKRKRSLAVVKP
jgi:hypothetical protein